MMASEFSEMVPIEFSPKCFRRAFTGYDNVASSQTKRKLSTDATSSPQLLKYRKISSGITSPLSVITESIQDSDSGQSMDVEVSEKKINCFPCNNECIRKYLKIKKPCCRSYKVLSTVRHVENIRGEKNSPMKNFRKITDYFKSSLCLKTPKNVEGHSEAAALSPVDDAIEKSAEDSRLIGNFSRPHSLPTVKGKHPDLPSISPETMSKVLKGEYDGSFVIVDCRYPYEYEGGHIIGAKNFYTKSQMAKKLFSSTRNLNGTSVPILIFHCEFSSERGPKMFRFVRNKDRELNSQSYPSLYYPEMYILEGGYSAFYASYKTSCDPQSYKLMRDENHIQDMVNCRAKTKADNGNYNRKSFRDRVKPRILF